MQYVYFGANVDGNELVHEFNGAQIPHLGVGVRNTGADVISGTKTWIPTGEQKIFNPYANVVIVVLNGKEYLFKAKDVNTTAVNNNVLEVDLNILQPSMSTGVPWASATFEAVHEIEIDLNLNRLSTDGSIASIYLNKIKDYLESNAGDEITSITLNQEETELVIVPKNLEQYNTIINPVQFSGISTLDVGFTAGPAINGFSASHFASIANKDNKSQIDLIAIDTVNHYSSIRLFNNIFGNTVQPLTIFDNLHTNEISLLSDDNKVYIGTGGTEATKPKVGLYLQDNQLTNDDESGFSIEDFNLNTFNGDAGEVNLDNAVIFPLHGTDYNGTTATATMFGGVDDTGTSLADKYIDYDYSTGNTGNNLYEYIEANSVKVGEIIHIAGNTNDSSDSAFQAWKKYDYDGSSTTDTVAGDLFMYCGLSINQSAVDNVDSQYPILRYIGNLSAEGGTPSFAYTMENDSSTISKVSLTSSADSDAFAKGTAGTVRANDNTEITITNVGSRHQRIDLRNVIDDIEYTDSVTSFSPCSSPLVENNLGLPGNGYQFNHEDSEIFRTNGNLKYIARHGVFWMAIKSHPHKLYRVNLIDFHKLTLNGIQHDAMTMNFNNIPTRLTNPFTENDVKSHEGNGIINVSMSDQIWYNTNLPENNINEMESVEAGTGGDGIELVHSDRMAVSSEGLNLGVFHEIPDDEPPQNFPWDNKPNNARIIGICETFESGRIVDIKNPELFNYNEAAVEFKCAPCDTTINDVSETDQYSTRLTTGDKVMFAGLQDDFLEQKKFNVHEPHVVNMVDTNKFVVQLEDGITPQVYNSDGDGFENLNKHYWWNSKVWVLYAKNTDEPFEKWELFLYNANTLDFRDDNQNDYIPKQLNMADRTIPYSECGYHQFTDSDHEYDYKLYYPRQFAHLMHTAQPNMNKYLSDVIVREYADLYKAGVGWNEAYDFGGPVTTSGNLVKLDSSEAPFGFAIAGSKFAPNLSRILRWSGDNNSSSNTNDINYASAWGIYDKTGRWICNGGKTIFDGHIGDAGGGIQQDQFSEGAPRVNPYITKDGESNMNTDLSNGLLFWGHNIGWACDNPRKIIPIMNSLHPLVHYSRSFLAGRIYKGSNSSGVAQNSPKHAVSFLGKTSGKFIKRPHTYERQNQGSINSDNTRPLNTFTMNFNNSHTDNNDDNNSGGYNLVFDNDYGDGKDKHLFDLYEEDITLYQLDEWTGHPGIVYKNYLEGDTPSQTDYGIWRARPNFGGPEIEWPNYKPWVMIEDNADVRTNSPDIDWDSSHKNEEEHYAYGRLNKAYGQMCSSVNRGGLDGITQEYEWQDKGWTGYTPPALFKPGKGYYVFINRTWKSANLRSLRNNELNMSDESGFFPEVGGWKFQSATWPSDNPLDQDSNSNRWHNFSSTAVGDAMTPDYPGGNGYGDPDNQRDAFAVKEFDTDSSSNDDIWIQNKYVARAIKSEQTEDGSNANKIKFDFDDDSDYTTANVNNIMHTEYKSLMTGAVCTMHKLDLPNLGEINSIFPTVLKTKANPDDNVFLTNLYVPAYVCGVKSKDDNPGIAVITNNLIGYYQKYDYSYKRISSGLEHDVWGFQNHGVYNYFKNYGQFLTHRDTSRNNYHNHISFFHNRDSFNLETTPITAGIKLGVDDNYSEYTYNHLARTRNAAIKYYTDSAMASNLTIFDTKPSIPLSEGSTPADGTISGTDADSLNLFYSVSDSFNNKTFFARKDNVFDLETENQNIYIDNADSEVDAVSGETGGYFIDTLFSGSNDTGILSESDTNLTFNLGEENDTDAGVIKGGTYKYKIALEYDNQYESALSITPFQENVPKEEKEITITNTDGEDETQIVDKTYDSIELLLKIKSSQMSSFSKRVTGVSIYRTGPDIDNAYGLVGNGPLKFNTNTFSYNSLNYTYTAQISDSGTSYQYHELNGISPEATNTSLNYGMATIYRGYMYVTHCYHPELKDVRNYIFRSLPNNFFTYDWANEFCIMPEEPVAMTSFNSRLYVWGKNKLYKVDPIHLVIEDEYEGISIASPESFVKTEFGLCFLDVNNIYLHDGNKPNPIGGPILEAASFPSTADGDNLKKLDSGYRELVKQTIANGHKPNVFYFSKENSFAVNLSDSDNNGKMFTYNIVNKRWDLADAPKPVGVTSSKDGSVLIGDGQRLYDFASSPDEEYAQYMRKEWTWHSKEFVLDGNTQNKVFKGLNIVGTPSFYNIGQNSSNLAFTDTINNSLSIRAYIDDEQVKLTRENKFYSSVLLGESYLSKSITKADTKLFIKTRDVNNNLQEFVRPGHYIKINSEVLFVNDYTKTHDGTDTVIELTVDRGQLNTTIVNHEASDNINVISPRLKFASGSKGKRLKIVLEGQRGYVDSIGVIYKSKGIK